MTEFEFEGPIAYSDAYPAFCNFMHKTVLPALNPEACDLQEIHVRVYRQNAYVVWCVLVEEDVSPFKVVSYREDPSLIIAPPGSYTTVVFDIATPYSLAGLM
jgi:hypothetical protein